MSLATVVVLVAATSRAAEREDCQPSAEIQQALPKIASSGIFDEVAFDDFIKPFQALRQAHPDNLFVHTTYQDAVNARGIEGHLKALTEEYLALHVGRSSGLKFHYLFARTLQGRSTPQAIIGLQEVLSKDAQFAPAYRALAEIYGSSAFRDRAKEKAARASFEKLCPRSAIASWPPSAPPKSALWSQVESLLRQPQSDERVPDLVYHALQQDEWRLQRIRPYDWYTVKYKKQTGEELQSDYWRGWRSLVQHYWKTNQTAQADQLISQMQDRLSKLEKAPRSDVYWTGAGALLDIYAEQKRPEQIQSLLTRLHAALRAKPSAKHAAQLVRLQRKYSSRAAPRARRPLAGHSPEQ